MGLCGIGKKFELASSFFAFTSSTVFSLISGVVLVVSVLSTSTSCLQQDKIKNDNRMLYI